MNYQWLDGAPVVTLKKHLTHGEITWNSYFSDPKTTQNGIWLKKDHMGGKVIFNVKYIWDDVYGGHYSGYKIWIERKNETGSWVEIPGGFHQTTAKEFGYPASHSEGFHDKTFEILVDEGSITFRIRAAILTGESGSYEEGEGSTGRWDYANETKEFEIRFQITSCGGCR